MPGKLFGLFFGFVFAIIVIGIGFSAFMAVNCYTSGDPNSMACYMISQRNEIGIRTR